MSSARWLISISLLTATLVYLHFFTATEVMPIRQPLSRMPSAIGEWRGAESVVLDDDTLEVLKPSDYLLRRYVDSNERSVWLYVGYWETQRKGAQIHSPKNCLPGGGWEPLEATQALVPIGDAKTIEVNRYVLQRGRDRQIAIYWFQSQGRAAASELEARIDLVRGAILRNRSDGAIVRITSPVFDGIAETSERLVKYVQAVYPILGDFLPN